LKCRGITKYDAELLISQGVALPEPKVLFERKSQNCLSPSKQRTINNAIDSYQDGHDGLTVIGNHRTNLNISSPESPCHELLTAQFEEAHCETIVSPRRSSRSLTVINRLSLIGTPNTVKRRSNANSKREAISTLSSDSLKNINVLDIVKKDLYVELTKVPDNMIDSCGQLSPGGRLQQCQNCHKENCCHHDSGNAFFGDILPDTDASPRHLVQHVPQSHNLVDMVEERSLPYQVKQQSSCDTLYLNGDHQKYVHVPQESKTEQICFDEVDFLNKGPLNNCGISFYKTNLDKTSGRSSKYTRHSLSSEQMEPHSKPSVDGDSSDPYSFTDDSDVEDIKFGVGLATRLSSEKTLMLPLDVVDKNKGLNSRAHDHRSPTSGTSGTRDKCNRSLSPRRAKSLSPQRVERSPQNRFESASSSSGLDNSSKHGVERGENYTCPYHLQDDNIEYDSKLVHNGNNLPKITIRLRRTPNSGTELFPVKINGQSQEKLPRKHKKDIWKDTSRDKSAKRERRKTGDHSFHENANTNLKRLRLKIGDSMVDINIPPMKKRK
jgi:hypothetical protein